MNDGISSPDIQIFRQVDMSKLGTPEFYISPEVSSKLSQKYLKVINEKHKSLLKENGYLANTEDPQNANMNNGKPNPQGQAKMTIEQVQTQVMHIENFFKSMQPQQLAGINRLYDVFTSLSAEEKKQKFQSMQPAQQQIITMVGKLREFYKYKDKWKQQKLQQLQQQHQQQQQQHNSPMKSPATANSEHSHSQGPQNIYNSSSLPAVDNNNQRMMGTNGQETINPRGLLNALANKDGSINHPYTPLLAVYNGNSINSGAQGHKTTIPIQNMVKPTVSVPQNGSSFASTNINGAPMNSSQNTPIQSNFSYNVTQTPMSTIVPNNIQQQNISPQMPQQTFHLPNSQNEGMFSEEDKKFILSKLPKLPQIPEHQVVYVDPPLTKQADPFYWSNSVAKERSDLVSRLPMEIAFYEIGNYKDREFSNRMIRNVGKQVELKSQHGFSVKEVEERWTAELEFYASAFKKRQSELKQKQLTGQTKKKMVAPQWIDDKNRLPYYDVIDSSRKVSLQEPARQMKIPIRLDFNEFEDGFELKDCFLIIGNDFFITVDQFVNALIKDYQFQNSKHFTDKIKDRILIQIITYQDIGVFDQLQDSKDLRIAINLNIVHGNLSLKDTFEWDISNKLNDPRQFADQMCEELELTAEFANDIEFSICEQVQNYLKLLVLQGNDIFLQGYITNDDLRKTFLPNMEDLQSDNNELLFRNVTDLKTFATSLSTLTPYGIEDLISTDSKKEEEMEENVKNIIEANNYDDMADLNNSGHTLQSQNLSNSRSDGLLTNNGINLGPEEDLNDLDSMGSSRRTHERINYYEGTKGDFDVSSDEKSMPLENERRNKSVSVFNMDPKSNSKLELSNRDAKNFSSILQLLERDVKERSLGNMKINDIPKILSTFWYSKYGRVKQNSATERLIGNTTCRDISQMFVNEPEKTLFSQGKLVNNSPYVSNKFIGGIKKQQSDLNRYKVTKSVKYGPQRCYVLPNSYNIGNGFPSSSNADLGKQSVTGYGELFVKFKFLKNKHANFLKHLLLTQSSIQSNVAERQ